MPYQCTGITVNGRFCYVYTDKAGRDAIAREVGFSKEYEKNNCVMVSFSRTNLIKIGKVFSPVPRVMNGQWHIDNLKKKVKAWSAQGDTIRKILAKPNSLKAGEEPIRVPYTYQFKVPPKNHQEKVFMVLDLFPELNVMLDCGTGKTFILLTSTEYKIQKGTLGKGKTLVSCPLSIIETSWLDDAKRFTNLKIGVLWSSKTSKISYLGMPEVYANHQDKPLGAVTYKATKRMAYRSKIQTNVIVPKLDAFMKKKREEWEKVEIKQQIAILENGEKIPYGVETLRTCESISLKKKHIQEMLADTSYDMYVINHDGARLFEDELKKHRFEQVIVDESTKIKNTKSKVFKAHTAISSEAKCRYAMSGTPAPNGAIDLWSQFFFTDRGLTLEPSYKDFRKMFFNEFRLGERKDKESGKIQSIVKYTVKSEVIDEISRRISNTSVRYRQDECLDLPARISVPRHVPLTAGQTTAYLEMEKSLLSEFVDKDGKPMVVEASTSLVKMLRLRQLTSGFASAIEGQIEDLEAMDGYGTKQLADFPENPKMEVLSDIVNEIGSNKIVVVTSYQHEIDLIMNHFQGQFKCDFIDGRRKPEDRPALIRDFQSNPDFRLVCIHPQAAGHGLTLTAASYMVFFSLTPNFEHEYQAAKRIERMGQQNKMFMYYLQGRLDPSSMDQEFYSPSCDTVDMVLYALLREKEWIQAQLIDGKKVKDFDMKERAFHDILEQMIRRHNEKGTDTQGKDRVVQTLLRREDGLL
jgi:superfamily II DNA or RNA helicase